MAAFVLLSCNISNSASAAYGINLAGSPTTDGWVVALQPGQAVATLRCRDLSGHYLAGRYIRLYDGDDWLEFGFETVVANAAPEGWIEIDVTPSSIRRSWQHSRFVTREHCGLA